MGWQMLKQWIQSVRRFGLHKRDKFSLAPCAALFRSEGHPWCLRWNLLGAEAQMNLTLQRLLSLPLFWYWVSQAGCLCAQRAAPECTASAPRSLTTLLAENLSALLTDLQEECDGYGREVLLLGLSEPAKQGMSVLEEVRKFLKLAPSQVRMVLLHLEDDRCDYLYFNPMDTEVLHRWLPHMGIQVSSRLPVYPYKQLYTASLDIRIQGLAPLLREP